MKEPQITEVVLTKVIYGGQTLGELADGKKVFVWGGLPGETATVQITKSKKNWAEGIAQSIVNPSGNRVEPADPDSYLSTSPWQIMSYERENQLKQELIVDQFKQHEIELKLDDYSAPDEPYHYRNKVEFSFWWNKETEQLDLAFYMRGTHNRRPVSGTSIAKDCINQAAARICEYLRAEGAEARNLKSLILRCDQNDSVIAQLYIKTPSTKLKPLLTKLGVAGFSIYFSNPKSPASVITKTLFESGEKQLTDTILGNQYSYAVDGFFQVNLPMYEATLKVMKKYVDPHEPLLDMYSGVGSIGLSLAGEKQYLTLVELNERCVAEAEANAAVVKPDTGIVQASSENAVNQITADAQIILDPPRAGLHEKVVNRLLEVKPSTVLYLSCNPATQARDIALLEEAYTVEYAHGFNFFPRTPHIENLVVLRSK